MEVIKGSGSHVDACMVVAGGLRDFFDERAMERMPGDLRTSDLWVAEDDGTVLGFIAIDRTGSGVAEIRWMGVRRERWRDGVGSALLARAEEELVAGDVELLEVKTLAPTAEYAPYEGTRAFYEARGFRLLEIVDPYPGWAPGNPCAIYVKAIRMR